MYLNSRTASLASSSALGIPLKPNSARHIIVSPASAATIRIPAGILVHHYVYIIDQIWHTNEDRRIHDAIDYAEGRHIMTSIAVEGKLQIPLSTLGWAMLQTLHVLFSMVTETQPEWMIPVWNVVNNDQSIARIATRLGRTSSNESNILSNQDIVTTQITPSGIYVLPPSFTGTKSTIKTVLYLLQRALRICWAVKFEEPIRLRAPAGTQFVSDATATGFRLSLTILKDGTREDPIDWEDVAEAFVKLIQSVTISDRWETFVSQFQSPEGPFAEVKMWKSYTLGENVTNIEGF